MFKGLWPVMLTPFKDDKQIDFDGLRLLTEFYLKSGVNGLFTVCLSNEMFDLSEEEKLAVAKTVLKVCQDNAPVPVVASGTFGRDLQKNVAFIKKITDLGTDAAVIISNQLNDESDPEELFKEKLSVLMDATGNIPLGTYECPDPYKRLLSPRLMGWMADSGRFIYHKDTSCDLENIRQKLEYTRGSSLAFFNANTPTGIASLKLGAQGISPIGANFYPELFSYAIRNYNNTSLEHQVAKVLDFLDTFDPTLHRFYPYSAKYFLKKRGLNIGTTTRIKTGTPETEDIEQLDLLFNAMYELMNELEIVPV